MRILLVIFFCVFLLSCIGDNPGTKGFTGTWKNASGAQLQLIKDGSFAGKCLPTKVFFQKDDTTHPLSFDGYGHWFIQEWKFQFPRIRLDFDSTNINLRCSCDINISGSGFFENNPPWNNLFKWEEEDGGKRYEFVRQVK